MAESSYREKHKDGEADLVFFGLPGVYVPKGAHVAHFFRGEEEQLRVLGPFLHAGLEAGDQCSLIAPKSAVPGIQDGLARLGIDVESALACDQLLISDGSLDIQEMFSAFESVAATASNAGRAVIRSGGDMTWALEKMLPPEKLLEWEALYDGYVESRFSCIDLCQYDQTLFSGSAIMDALQTHPLSIIGSVVQQNPFHRDAQDVLRELSRSGS